MKTKKRTYKKGILVCECGMTIFGISEKHAQSNLKRHQKSKRHKHIMKDKGGENGK